MQLVRERDSAAPLLGSELPVVTGVKAGAHKPGMLRRDYSLLLTLALPLPLRILSGLLSAPLKAFLDLPSGSGIETKNPTTEPINSERKKKLSNDVIKKIY